MRELLVVAGGGALGAAARYLLSGWAQRLAGGVDFPVGTLVVNVLGCLVLGAAMEASLSAGVLSSEGRAALTIGFLGAFTTFSTFGYETFRILEARQWGLVALNLGAQLGLGLLGVTAGVMLGRWVGSLL